MIRAKSAVLVLTLGLLSIQSACTSTSSDVEIINAWTRPFQVDSGLSTALYFSLENNSNESVQLTGAEISAADTVEIHRSEVIDGLMRMRAQQNVTIQSKEVIHFEPGSHHLMIKGLKTDLSLDDSLQFTLHFANRPSKDAKAVVKWE